MDVASVLFVVGTEVVYINIMNLSLQNFKLYREKETADFVRESYKACNARCGQNVEIHVEDLQRVITVCCGIKMIHC